MKEKAATWVHDTWSDKGHHFADQVWEQEPDRIELLGPDGKSLWLKKQPIGFDLRPKKPSKDYK